MEIDFRSLGIGEELTSILEKSGISEPTPVQKSSIPVLLEKKDIIAQAQTGTGKTLAFLLPIMQHIDITKQRVQALIISPTRELAQQITAEAKKLSAFKEINILAAYGGEDVEKQIRRLKGGIHLVVGTPGRLLDHINRKSVDFNKLSMLVLDEVDQITDMGFLPDVEKIISKLPPKRQTMLFSATITKGVRKTTAKYTKNPHQVIINTKNITLDQIKQKVMQTTNYSKQDALCKIIDEENPFMAIIFCNTKERARSLNFALQRIGYDSDELQGNMIQSKRERVIKKFRELKLRFLVATDIAARGLDIEGVTHIINYDIPSDAESYIHRIGRTGRAGQDGIAISFATPQDREALGIIEDGIRVKLEKRKISKEELPERKEEFMEDQERIDRKRKPVSKDSKEAKRFNKDKSLSKGNVKNVHGRKPSSKMNSTNKEASNSRKKTGEKRKSK
jgi:ATP-dependent RNA helicase DeaD